MAVEITYKCDACGATCNDVNAAGWRRLRVSMPNGGMMLEKLACCGKCANELLPQLQPPLFPVQPAPPPGSPTKRFW